MVLEFTRLKWNYVTILHQHCTNAFQWSIFSNHEITYRIRHNKDWCTGQTLLKIIKCYLTLVWPNKLLPFPLKRSDEMGYLWEILHEVIVVTHQYHETTNFWDISGCQPIHDSMNLLRIHYNSITSDDMSQILHLWLEDPTFTQVSIQLMVSQTLQNLT